MNTKVIDVVVSVNVLQFNDKKMTLAMFRQITKCPSDEIPAESKIFGYVNYEVDDESHWLVFTDNGKLFRAGGYNYHQSIVDNARDWLKADSIERDGGRHYGHDRYNQIHLRKKYNKVITDRALLDTWLKDNQQIFIAV